MGAAVDASSTEMVYVLAAGTAFHVNVGVAVDVVPVGLTGTGAGGTSAGTVIESELLHGPLPAAFAVRIHQVATPGARATEGVTAQTPVPDAHPAAAAV